MLTNKRYFMFFLYKSLLYLLTPALYLLLHKRVKQGKEDPARLKERYGFANLPCPKGALIWIHAASVGEAQSTLILINKILQKSPATHILVTSGTVTSAKLMAERLPSRAVHQYAPLDHPKWINRFLEHWQPDLALRMESELWPTTLLALKAQKIPTILINARLSDNSFRKWTRFKGTAQQLLSSFTKILTQTDKDTDLFKQLGATHVQTIGNLKYSAEPLFHHPDELAQLAQATKNRPLWVYASTHDGEEELACEIHQRLQADHPELLSIIVPRHPERRDQIKSKLEKYELGVTLRGKNKTPPAPDTDIYIADTLGELGLFYRLAPIAVIGKSFSHEGGGHNPIEAAQLNCAILTGPKTELLQDIFDDMRGAGAVYEASNHDDLYHKINDLLSNPSLCTEIAEVAIAYIEQKTDIIDKIINELTLT